ncbi:hypothetical protein DWY99_06210 [[Clostridium] leptum]|uniref:Uncharacterized protein n=1 Tax=[Clostridium] leptum TaxID=1535 RepID=A0A412AY08_9FIRM|nr:hypothetical protein DWY99_06210 [[Clostridium] leptum]
MKLRPLKKSLTYETSFTREPEAPFFLSAPGIYKPLRAAAARRAKRAKNHSFLLFAPPLFPATEANGSPKTTQAAEE